MTHGMALKTALHLLVQRLGGVEAAGSVIGRNPGRVSDAQAHHKPDTMLPADQVVALEAIAGEPLVTAAMARAAGYRLIRDGGRAEPDATLPARVGAVMADMGALLQVVSQGLADGGLDDRERATAHARFDELRLSVDGLAAAFRRVA